ncbi:MAG: SAM-dependent methyltransferase [Chromatiaceae bacterium]|nr:MAG: SAM-dependent methyltransferase [Chromatiaceae bacterium]
MNQLSDTDPHGAALEQLPAHLAPFNCVWHHRLMLAAVGLYLRPRARVLDFGCGSGADVYAYRDSGYDAYGFDMAAGPDLRCTEDRHLFRSLASSQPGDPDYRVPRDYRMDFPDGFFDLVVSNSVFEHVQDPGLALREIARVMRPGAVSIHLFPARYRLIEPHILVPLGGILSSPAWYRLWAWLGVRNRFQQGLSATEVVAANLRYRRIGIHYPPVRHFLELARPHFAEVRLAPELWTLGSLRHPLVRLPMGRWLYSRIATVVLWLRK